MSRRGYASSDVYEERDRDYYTPRRGGRTAEYDEIDIRERRRESGRQPDFLREDYGRSSNAGQLVVRDSKREEIEVSRERPRSKDVVREKDEQIYIHKGAREPERSKYRGSDIRTDRSEVATYRRDSPEPEIREEIIYRDRERDYPSSRQQVAREREEFVFRERERERDYPPPLPPQQIAREREEFVFRPKPREPAFEREEITIREREREPERARDRDFIEEELIIRRDDRERERPRGRDRYDDEEIIIRRDEHERDRPRGKDYHDEQEEIIIRRGEGDRPKPRARSYERESLTIRDDRSAAPRAKSRDYREEDITIRRSDRDRGPRARSRDTKYSEEDIIIRHEEREARRPRSRSRDTHQDELVIRRSSYSRERERPRARSRDRDDEEDIIIRHNEDKRGHKDEVIIRRNERSPSLESYRPPPEPEPVRAPPIHQEIITHHRHIEHGFESAPRPRSPPRRRSPSPKDDFQQIEIRRRGSRNGRAYDEDIIIDSGPPARRPDRGPVRRRSPSPIRRRSPSPIRSHYHSRSDELDIAEEADYYNARAAERSYIGEGYHGHTRDWAIVDVPPGTKRVQMEGVGGAREDITWSRYNGVRRSKFMAEDDGYREDSRPRGGHDDRELDIEIRESGARGGERELDVAIRDNRGPEREQDEWNAGRRYVKQEDKKDRMWTEITKDLVSIEAIKEMGYEYEETEFFFYVFKYLKYEEVQALTDLSTDIKHGRRSRIRQIEAEREAEVLPPRRKQLAGPPGWDEERIVEREIIYNDGPPRRGYR